MKLVVNDYIPFPGYKCMALWPFIFIRRAALSRYTKTDDNHEEIHGEQQKEMLIIFFLLWYLIEWLIRLIIYRNQAEAYRNISFEQEAYEHESDLEYLNKRKRFNWIKYIFKKTYKKRQA